jgi:hypothetical protein
LVPRGAQWTAPILAPDWAAGAHDGNGLARLAGPTRDQRIVAPIGDAWLGIFPEVFRDTARPAIADAGSDVTSAQSRYLALLSNPDDAGRQGQRHEGEQ